MPRITTEERAAALGRALRRLRDLPEVLLVADDATVWGIDRSSVEPGWLLTDRLVPPPGATALEPAVVERARAALRRVSRVRDVESLLVFPALRGWSAADVRGVSGDGLERVAWAFAPERSASRPRGVLMSAPGGALRFRTRVTLPAVGGRALAFDLAVADRLFDLYGPRLADRWLRSCAARAWPDVELSGELARLHDVVDAASDVRAVSEVVREWAYARFGAGELASAARAAPDLGALRAVLARIVDELWPGERAADAVLTLLLADPDARYAVPGREEWQIYDLAYTLRSASPRWRARTRAHVPRWLAEPLLDVPFPIQKLPADLAIRVMRVREGFPAPQSGWPGRKLAATSRCSTGRTRRCASS